MNVLVNEKKSARAKLIVDILGRTPRNEEETNLKDTFSRLLKEDKVGEKDVLEYVYTKLGGLVRTEAEVKKAKAVKKEAEAKFSKKSKEK